jgi:hypothetical protein
MAGMESWQFAVLVEIREELAVIRQILETATRPVEITPPVAAPDKTPEVQP